MTYKIIAILQDPHRDPLATKEAAAMLLEQLGGKVVVVEVIKDEQVRIGGKLNGTTKQRFGGDVQAI